MMEETNYVTYDILTADYSCCVCLEETSDAQACKKGRQIFIDSVAIP